jgi:hypothetical protein
MVHTQRGVVKFAIGFALSAMLLCLGAKGVVLSAAAKNLKLIF